MSDKPSNTIGFMINDVKRREFAVAELLDQAAMPLGGYAAERLMAKAHADTSPMDAFHWWQSYLASRIRDLAAAVYLGRPGLFVRQLQWCMDALAAKHIGPDELKAALGALAEVIASEMQEAGPRIAHDYIRPATDALNKPTDGAAPTLDTTQPTGRLASAYILAILEGDRRRAAELVHVAVDGGMAVREAYLDVLAPAVREIGLMWHRNEISIAEEHFATATSQIVMAQLLGRSPKPSPNDKTVVVASVVGDRHGLGTQVVADFFEMDGWRVIYLGPDIPGHELPQALVDFQADLLLLSATLYTHLRAMEATIHMLHQSMPDRHIPVLVGGHAFTGNPGLAEQIGADGYAADADAAAAVGRKLVGLTARD